MLDAVLAWTGHAYLVEGAEIIPWARKKNNNDIVPDVEVEFPLAFQGGNLAKASEGYPQGR